MVDRFRQILDFLSDQEACDAGPPELAQRLAMGAALLPKEVREKMPYLQQAAQGLLGSWRYLDVKTPIVQGLIGGGLEPNAAGRLWREYGDEFPLIDNVPLALAVVMASIVGAPDEPLGEPQTGEATISPEASSASPPSTAPRKR